jgi:DUF971 family protein
VPAAEIEVAEDGRSLVVATDGRRRALSAARLWAECPSAAGRVRRARGRTEAPPGLTITSVRVVGLYGVNIAFSDGHDRGIYPWGYLAALSERPRLEDFLTD